MYSSTMYFCLLLCDYNYVIKRYTEMQLETNVTSTIFKSCIFNNSAVTRATVYKNELYHQQKVRHGSNLWRNIVPTHNNL